VSKIHPSETGCSREDSTDYAYKLVGKNERDFLLTLPKHLRLTFELNNESVDVLLVHGSPRSINEYLLEDLPENYVLAMLKEYKADILCFGHSHKPYHRIVRSGSDSKPHFHHLINIGSVGKPKDEDPRACYVLLTVDKAADFANPDGVKVDFIRVQYDVEKAAQAIELSLLPDDLADRLRRAM
jgi:predicted phosphodiesterase